MPAYNPSQLHELVQHLIEDNNNNLIDPADVRQVLDAIIDSVYNLVATPNPEAPKLENVLLEGNLSGPKDIVMSTGRYVVFKGTGSNSVRVRPLQGSGGSPDAEVNLPLKPGTLALLSDIGRIAWLQPVLGQRDQQAGTEVAGDRWIVGPGASGDYAGHAGEIVERTNDGWVFTPTQDGDMVRCLSDTAGVIRTKVGGVWVMPESITDVLSLALVLGIGNMTGGHDIEVSAPDAVAFRNNGHLMRLVGQDIAEDHTVIMPDAGGTLATVQQVAQLLFGIDLHAVLVNGTETNGRSITVSEGDGINYRAGTKQVRVKAPTTLTADRNVQWPDKSGTVATTDDVDAIAGQLDGKLAKASNLIDLTNAATARTNLGLRSLAVEDYADALVSRVVSDAMVDAIGVSRVVIMQPDGRVNVAGGASISQQVGMVRQVSGGSVRVQYTGVFDEVPGVVPGVTYYLDPTTPGAITPIRPAAGAIIIGDGWGYGKLNFAPQPPISSGSNTLASDVFTIDAAGSDTGLLVYLVPGATYEVSVYAQVYSEAGAGRCLLRLDCDGASRGRLSYSKLSGAPDVQVDLLIADLSAFDGSAEAGAEDEELECSMSALVKIDEHSDGVCRLFVAPQSSGKRVYMRAGSTMTYKRIG